VWVEMCTAVHVHVHGLTATVQGYMYIATCAGVVFTSWALLCGTGTGGVVSSCMGDWWWSVQ